MTDIPVASDPSVPRPSASAHDAASGPTVARLERLAVALTRRVAAVGVAGMLVVGILASADVLVFRAILGDPIVGFNEVLQTVFAVAIASVLAAGLAERANLQVDIVGRAVGPRVAAWLEVGSAVALAVLFAVLAWRCGVQAAQAMRIDSQTTILQFATAPFLWAVTAFVALCVPVQLVVLLSSVAGAMVGRRPGDPDAGTDAGAAAGATRTVAAAASAPTPRFARVVARAALALGVGVAVAALAVWAAGELRPVVRGHPIGIAAAMFALLWVLVLAMAPVGVALMVAGLLGTALLMGFPRALLVFGSETVNLVTSAELALIPLFLMMGAFATVGGMSADIYRLAQATLGPRRGGVAMATVAGCAGFGALTGSSIATAATIGAVALPEMKRRGYASSLATGCVAAGATLGQLVPPSTIIVLYAILVEESIGALYIAILVPAALSIVLYLAAIAIVVRLRPDAAPGHSTFDASELVAALKRSVGVLVLFVGIIGGIYTGVFTATEAAAIGAVFTFLIALLRGKLSRDTVWEVAGETTRSVAMIYVLIIGALMMSFFMSLSGLPAYLVDTLGASGLPPLAIIVALVVLFVILGTVMDATAVMIITAGVVAPLVTSLGYDPLWWGVMMVVLVEIGVVTPPFGINLFVLKSFDRSVPLTDIYRGVMPFVGADVLKVVLLIAFPALALWLPATSG